jgi:hypothetical protein
VSCSPIVFVFALVATISISTKEAPVAMHPCPRITIAECHDVPIGCNTLEHIALAEDSGVACDLHCVNLRNGVQSNRQER